MRINPPIKPPLDPGYTPPVMWNREYKKLINESPDWVAVAIGLFRSDGTCSVHRTRLLPDSANTRPLTLRYLERTLKFLLWQRGGTDIHIAGCDDVTKKLSQIYSGDGPRRFDWDFLGNKAYLRPLQIQSCEMDQIQSEIERETSLGRHQNGCRIGFDLGGSDRKSAALIDGKLVFSEEQKWNPYFERNPEYHVEAIKKTLQRAASHLPRVDCIGGSTAGIMVNNEVRASSLFRGVSSADFNSEIRPVFLRIQKEYGNIPVEVVNDGEVTALAGAMSTNSKGVLGVSMGTSLAAGYVNPEGNITSRLNELAFTPVDYQDGAPLDEWSLDRGCGVQYFSQQAVARLAGTAGLGLPEKMPHPQKLVAVQERMSRGDPKARSIYATIGIYLGYAIAHWSEFYDFETVLLLGRVTSGAGGGVILENAEEVLDAVFPDVMERVKIATPGERDKRLGQAIAAASLPEMGTP